MARYRSIDGSSNNLNNPTWGEADTQLLRFIPPAYEDGISQPRGGDPSSLPSAREISNAVASQSQPIYNSLNASDLLWQWGQFIDHDLDLTEAAEPHESFNIPVPTGDPDFDPNSTGTQEIALDRSLYDSATGTGPNHPRQQLNEITAYLDASMVYGSDRTRADALRAFEGGMLKTSDEGKGLPYNTEGLPNAGGSGENFYLAGDVRANEQVGLTALHTLFVREHNRIASELRWRLQTEDSELRAKFRAFQGDYREESPDATREQIQDEFLYQTARKVVGAEIQAITYNEFLPILLGEGWIDEYTGYDETVNAGIANEFATAAYRVGHTMLPSTLLRVDNHGNDLDPIALRNAFFNPDFFQENDIDELLKGLASQKAQEVDTHVIDDVRNFLFGPPGAGGFDLASLNIQRGRDHGLPSLNEARSAVSLSRYDNFEQLTDGDDDLAAKFASVYDSIDDVDLWIGGLAERHVNEGLVGETFHAILADQFERLRDGDRFFYLNDEHLQSLVPDIGETTLANIIRWNTGIANIQDNAFAIDETLQGDGSHNNLQGGVGNDYLNGKQGSDTLYGHSGNDTIYGGLGQDSIDGGYDDDIIYGGKRKDYIDGGYGDDTIYGGRGQDSIDGGYGDDVIYGGKRKDYIDGGYGDDRLHGGQGEDEFVLREGEGYDHIYGFEIHQDFFVLEGLDYSDLSFSHNLKGTVIKIEETDEKLAIVHGVYGRLFEENFI